MTTHFRYLTINMLELKKKVGRSFLGTLQAFLLAGFTHGKEYKLSLLGTALAGGICITMSLPISPPRIIVLKSERCGTAVTVGIWMCEELLQ